jgi:hypothetical protein
VKRRGFFLALTEAGLLVTYGWPGVGLAQTRNSRVGVLMIDGVPQWLEPFQRSLRDQGWIEGQNLRIEFRTARDDQGFANAAAELGRLKVDVIFAVGPPAVRATRAAAQHIPIGCHRFRDRSQSGRLPRDIQPTQRIRYRRLSGHARIGWQMDRVVTNDRPGFDPRRCTMGSCLRVRTPRCHSSGNSSVWDTTANF